jgi:hypothetical protein
MKLTPGEVVERIARRRYGGDNGSACQHVRPRYR